MPVLHLDQVTKTFGSLKALDQVTLSVHPGEVYGFIGPNGAGKTTAIRVLMGILQATSGQATLFGQDAWKHAVALHQRVAYVPGEVSLWPNLTGGEVIDLFVRLRRDGKTRYEDTLLERFDLDPSKKCRAYSKGNRQKVALVAAFASDADLYILDEPTSGLDPLMEEVFQQCVLEAKSKGKSVLLSSHILSEVEKLCDKVSIIRQGRIIESGSLQELRHLTRTFVRAKTMRPVTNLADNPHVHDVRQEADSLSFSVEVPHLGEVLSLLHEHGIKNLECMPPTLEQLFMSHYERGD